MPKGPGAGSKVRPRGDVPSSARAGCAAAGAWPPTIGWHLVTGESDEALSVVGDLREVEQGFHAIQAMPDTAIIPRPIRQIRFDGGDIAQHGGRRDGPCACAHTPDAHCARRTDVLTQDP